MYEIDLVQAPKVYREIGIRKAENIAIARQFGKEFFDGDRINGYGGYGDGGRYRSLALRLMLTFGVWTGERVLDIGCAKGYLVNDLNTLGVKAEGIDISEYAISHANDHCSVGDARNLEGYDSKEFALAVSITTIHNLEKDECAKALKEMVRISHHQYVTLDAWHNDDERKRMEGWNMTGQTMMHVDDWVKFFKEVEYTGEYGWFVA